MAKKVVVFSILGTTLDAGKGAERWERWRPTVALCQHEDLIVDRLVLLSERRFTKLARTVEADVRQVSPETSVEHAEVGWSDAWDFEEVYATLLDLARGYTFRTEAEEYLVHLTTGTHVAQICLFLLTEARYFPARVLQTSPPRGGPKGSPGSHTIIDLDLSRYDRIASRFATERREGQSRLKAGIETQNPSFNRLIERIEQVALASSAPMLLLGPTGAGKSQLAERIFELKKARRLLEGDFVPVNCATLRGDAAMSTLFGHKKGAFTGAASDRPGLLRKADGGLLFLDEIGDLGMDEQAMLLRAIEHKTFYPVGADQEVRSDFTLIAGTNRNLSARASRGEFRDDLLARINLWTFRLPALTERLEDLAPNLAFELDLASRALGVRVTINAAAREAYLAFALSTEATWDGNFRDLNASVTRLSTLAKGGRVDERDVQEEIERLRTAWARSGPETLAEPSRREQPEAIVPPETETPDTIDLFDRVQLDYVLRVCRASRSLSEAGRHLFAITRQGKSRVNDADRLRKYLARFGLSWGALAPADERP